MISTTTMPTTEGRKYCSAIDGGFGVGAGVAAGAVKTLIAVSDDDGQ